MKPILLFWKQKKREKWIDSFIEWCIYYFQKIKLIKTYGTQNIERKKEQAKIVHVGIYFPDIDKTYDMHGEYKFPFTFGGGARERNGFVSADFYVPFNGIAQDKYEDIKQLFLADVLAKVKYNFPQLIILIFVFLFHKIFLLINWIPFENDVFGERCISWIEVIFKKADIDLLPGHEEGNAVGELLFSEYLEPKQYYEKSKVLEYVNG